MSELAELMGRSAAIESVRATLRRLVGSSSASQRLPTVLIQGETGTGKGLVAGLLHRLGPRRDRAFVDINCAAIPDTLLESELFGHERGAFTDARHAKPGLFQIAHRGTIFLDEVGLLPEGLQAKLLKVVEERSVRRLGATQNEPADAWIISATNMDLAKAARERRFRPDLYHRLAVMTLSLPPLRERGEDALLLAEHYLARACADYGLPPRSLTPDARDRILAHRWPGNVRELANTMERAALLTESPQVTGALLELPEGTTRGDSLSEAARERMQLVLDQNGGNISRSAAALGITRNTLRAHMKKYGLGLPEAGRVPQPAPTPTAAGDTAGPAGGPSPPDSDVVLRFPAVRWERRLTAALAISLSCPADALAELISTRHRLTKELESLGARVEGSPPLEGALDSMRTCRIAALFGLTPTENAASRATHAALAMLRTVERTQGTQKPPVTATFAVDSSYRLIAQGPDLPTMDENDRREVDIALDQLLQGAEPSTIVVNHAAAEFVQRRFELEPASAIAGRRRIYRVTGPGRTGFEVGGRSLSPFVGRAPDLIALEKLLGHVKGGRGQVVGIMGEAGVGKSRLLYEFRRVLAQENVTYLEGRCLSYENTVVPYLPIIDIVRSCFALVEADTPEVVGEKVREGLAGLDMDPMEWVPYLLHLLSCGEGAESMALLSPETVKTQTMEALRRMCLAASRQRPVVLAVEDLHWIDRNSEDALSALADSLVGSPILLLATYRSGYKPPWLSRSYASQLALQALALPDSLAVVHSIVPEKALSPVLKETILARAEGIPFLLEELGRVVAEQQDEDSEIIVPDTIQAALTARLDRLPPEDREVLQTASVIGRDVSLPILGAVSDLPPPELGRRLTRLQAVEFLYEKSLVPVPEYSFKHALTHEAAYESTPRTRRRELHARVVKAIEAIHPELPSEQFDQLAQHAFRGEVWGKAVTYLRRAGERALRSSANREAARFFEDALSALGHLDQTPSTLEQAVDVRLNLRDALWALARLPQIKDHLEEADLVAHALGDRCREGWIACYLCQYSWSVVHLGTALEGGERALEIAESLPNPALRAETSFYLGLVYLALGEARRAAAIFSTNLGTLDQVVEAHRREFSSPRFAATGPVLVRGWMARVLAELGEFAEAETWARDAIRLGEAAKSPFALTAALAGLGASYVRKGQPEHALPPLERGLELCRTYNLNNWLPTVAASLGAAYVSLGRIEAGVALLEEAVNQGALAGIMSSYTLWLIYLGEAYLQAHRAADALAAGRRALALCREHQEGGYEAWALRLLAEIAASGDPPERDEAEARYQEALTLAERLGMRPLAARCQLGLGRLYERAGDRSRAETCRARGADLCRELGMPVATEVGGV